MHIHDAQEDSFYVLDGVLTVQMDDTVVDLNPGDFATAAPGVAHTFTNTARDKVARTVNIMTPGIGFDRYIAAAVSGIEHTEMERLEGSDHAVLDLFGKSRRSYLGCVELHFDRSLQVGSRGNSFRGKLVDNVVFSEQSHRRDESAKVDDFEVAR